VGNFHIDILLPVTDKSLHQVGRFTGRVTNGYPVPGFYVLYRFVSAGQALFINRFPIHEFLLLLYI
jgi:hypothetical protein